MTSQLNQPINLLRRTLASAPPDRITQEAFDHDDRHLRRLTHLEPGEQPQAQDLWKYTQDLRYTEIQNPLLLYLLPFCLEAWQEDLLGISAEYGGFVEHLYPVLADRHIFDLHLTPAQAAAVAEFMRQTILEEIDTQQGLPYQGAKARPYRWFHAMASYGVLLPDIERLWTAWWSLTTDGRAVAVLQYISCLMYPKYENPVFAPWTPNEGGGPPSLWEFEGHLYSHAWLESNIGFLNQFLGPPIARQALHHAVQRLVGPQREVAAQMLADLPLLSETLEARCRELPLILATSSESHPLEWSDEPRTA
jgi:hypothetical protein